MGTAKTGAAWTTARATRTRPGRRPATLLTTKAHVGSSSCRHPDVSARPQVDEPTWGPADMGTRPCSGPDVGGEVLPRERGSAGHQVGRGSLEDDPAAVVAG